MKSKVKNKVDNEFVLTPFIEEMVSHVGTNISKGGPYRFRVFDVEVVIYTRKFKKEIIKYFKDVIHENVKIIVRHNAIDVYLIRECSLCDGRLDFRKVLISEYSGVQMSNCLEQVRDYNKFNYCPKCGKKLTSKNFGGQKFSLSETNS